MAKQTFTAGQVLTATQMNNLQANDYNWTTSAQTSSYVLIAANAGQTVTMTSASATTITVNTGLFAAGDTVRIINLGAGNCTITAGTATVSTTGSLILRQNAAGTLWFSSASAAIFIADDQGSGMSVVRAETSFSASSSITADNVFTSSFTNYKLFLRFTSTTGSAIQLRLRTGGTGATTNYNFQYLTAFSSSTGAQRTSSNTFGIISYGSGGSFISTTELFLSGPNLAEATSYMAVSNTSDGAITAPYINNWFGNHSTATAYDGIELYPGSGTMTGTYTIYGLAK